MSLPHPPLRGGATGGPRNGVPLNIGCILDKQVLVNRLGIDHHHLLEELYSMAGLTASNG